MKSHYNNLHDLCRWDMPEQIQEILNQHHSLDITYDEGELFRIAALNGNHKLLQILITHHKQQFIDGHEEDYYLQKLAKYNLSEALHIVVDMGIKLSTEIQNLIAPYIIEQNDYDSNDEQITFSKEENFLKEFISMCEESNMILIGDSSRFLHEVFT